MAKKFKLTKQEKSWILYDVANSAFVLTIVTTIMPIFFKDVASAGVDPAVATSNWGFAQSLASAIVVVLALIVGAFADYKGRKIKFLRFFMLMGVIATALMVFIGPGDWFYCIILFLFGRIGFSGGNIFYDSLLPDVTDDERMDWVSTNGFGWGYIGSTLPFIISLIAVVVAGKYDQTGAQIPTIAAKFAFVLTAVWWFIFSLPVLKNVKQTHYIEVGEHPIKDTFVRLGQTFKEIKNYKTAFIFLIAYFFYIDGVDTIISMSAAYGRDIGLSTTMLLGAVLMIQVLAFPFALLYGRLAHRFSTKTMLYVGIIIYTILTFLGYMLSGLNGTTKMVMFWIMAFLVATSQGGIQALSRSYFGKLIPKEKAAEYFGFYNIIGKASVVMGPLLMGIVGRLTGDTKYGVLSIVVLFVIGFVLLSIANRSQKKDQQNQQNQQIQ